MASAVVSGLDLYTPNADWKTIDVQKRDSRGKICNTIVGLPQKFQYTLEVSTGDLYGLSGKPDPAHVIAAKAFFIFLGSSPYMVALMCANFVKIAFDITSVFWKVIPQMLSDIFKKSIFAALGNGFMSVVYEIPKEIVLDIWRICRSPLYTVGLMFASLYTLISPFEGRKWIGKIESEWHDGIPYKMNLNKQSNPENFYTDIAMGKVLFLAICMQKMGNIGDKVGAFDKFEIYNP